ncbi:hypothetical protein [Jiangella alkaliphila]|uniref:DUF3800 domain-containing protein n=1 Tax=Jiangella alkaliphila TaxID=419479 RepID=A0A1H2FZF3_9ACTN|nr:hypothetical protein [Jiangella alkaliphila]SDU12693.1 hypothetical protein SAMN04488563_0204 [Jiangella alkaliphila]
MALHAYADESKKNDYILAAALVSASDVAAARRVLRDLRIGKQRRIHFKDEKPARKEQVLAAALEVSSGCRLYVCGGRRSARENCLSRMVPDLVDLSVDRLVLELDTATELLDKRVLFEETRKAGAAMTYQHELAHHEPLLWVPDAIAWCWASGGGWRQRVADHVTVLDAG